MVVVSDVSGVEIQYQWYGARMLRGETHVYLALGPWLPSWKLLIPVGDRRIQGVDRATENVEVLEGAEFESRSGEDVEWRETGWWIWNSIDQIETR